MRYFFIFVVFFIFFIGCILIKIINNDLVVVNFIEMSFNLVEVINDKVFVVINLGCFIRDIVIYRLLKVV